MHRLQPAFDGIEVMDVGPIDALAPVFRKFVLTGMAPQSDTRKPLVFYNTWYRATPDDRVKYRINGARPGQTLG